MEKLLGKEIFNEIIKYTSPDSINEIRLRINRPILIKCLNKSFYTDYHTKKQDILNILDEATSHSRYAFEQEISDGYLQYGNGIRIGVCGSGKINSKNLIAYSSLTSLCIRFPHVIPLPDTLKQLTASFDNTLIIGPPYSGKTTLIRAIAAALSERNDVVIIDERYEIAGKEFALLNTPGADILQGIPKYKAYECIIRSMAPSVIVCDELFTEKDFIAVKTFISSGIKCLASFHAANISNIPDLLRKVFSTFIVVDSKINIGNIISIIYNDA